MAEMAAVAAAVKAAQEQAHKEQEQAVERAVAAERERPDSALRQLQQPGEPALLPARGGGGRPADLSRMHAAIRSAVVEAERGPAATASAPPSAPHASLHNAAVQRALAAGLARSGGAVPAPLPSGVPSPLHAALPRPASPHSPHSPRGASPAAGGRPAGPGASWREELENSADPSGELESAMARAKELAAAGGDADAEGDAGQRVVASF